MQVSGVLRDVGETVDFLGPVPYDRSKEAGAAEADPKKKVKR